MHNDAVDPHAGGATSASICFTPAEVSRDGVPNVSELLNLISSSSPDERVGALELLAGVVDNTFGTEDGAELGSVVRAGGGVAALSRLLLDPAPEIQQQALFVLGNLCSDSVDRDSSRTKSELLDCGGARALVGCVYSDDEGTLTLACGTLQNLVIDPAWAVAAHSYGVVPRLEALA